MHYYLLDSSLWHCPLSKAPNWMGHLHHVQCKATCMAHGGGHNRKTLGGCRGPVAWFEGVCQSQEQLKSSSLCPID